MTDASGDRSPRGPAKLSRAGFAEWWARNRDRLSLLAIGGVALGGIVCMFLTVLILVFA